MTIDAGGEGIPGMGLIRMWRRFGHRETSARMEAANAEARLADTARQVSELQRKRKDDRYAALLRDGIRGGYRPLEGGQR